MHGWLSESVFPRERNIGISYGCMTGHAIDECTTVSELRIEVEVKGDGLYLTDVFLRPFPMSAPDLSGWLRRLQRSRSSEAQGERRWGRWFGVGGSVIATFQKAIDLLSCTKRKAVSVEGMSHSAGPEIKLTIPRDSGGPDSAYDCEEDSDLGEREEHHEISPESRA